MKERWYILLALVIFLLATACTVIGSSTVPEGVLLQDDFSDPSSGWDQVVSDEGVTDYQDGYYRITVNTPATDVWSNPGLNLTDIVIETDTRKLSGPDDNDFGVICRYVDVDNFYFFIISSDGYYGIGRVVNGEQMILGDNTMSPTKAINQGNAENHILASCVGVELSLTVNDQLLGTVQDSSLESGDTGLIAGTFEIPGTDVAFDNFVVRDP